MSFENMNTPKRRRAVKSVGEILKELIVPDPAPVQVNVDAEEFRRLMREHGITSGSGVRIPSAVVTPR